MFAADAMDGVSLAGNAGQGAAKHGLLDQFDDSEGYYNFQVDFLSIISRSLSTYIIAWKAK